MRTLVTGGAGFIGSNLVDALVERGDDVAVLDNLSTGKRANLERRDRARRRAARGRRPRRGRRPGGVRRAPARGRLPSRRPDRRAPVGGGPRGRCRRPTCQGTIAVLEAARAAGTRRLVNTSTGGGLYGDADLLPTPEDYPIRPLAPYGQGKYAAEGYCGLYTRLHGLSTVSLRYGNVYGPRQDVHGEAGVVAIFCGHLVEGRAPTIFGDGRQTRDWVDVSDVVAAQPARCGVRAHRADQHRPRAGDRGARPARCAARRRRPAAGRAATSPPSARARYAAAAST